MLGTKPMLRGSAVGGYSVQDTTCTSPFMQQNSLFVTSSHLCTYKTWPGSKSASRLFYDSPLLPMPHSHSRVGDVGSALFFLNVLG